MQLQKGILRIGTSNIVVPGNKNSYPPEYFGKSRLNYYSSFFNSLEINSSFYKVPMPVTFEKWAKDVPADFRFSVKLSKEITHIKEPSKNINLIHSFLDSAAMLENKKGCLLIQFPGKITVHYYKQVALILKEINKHDPINEWRTAVEFRNPGWYISETFELMDEYNSSIVLHDIQKAKNNTINKNAAFVFIRFHGPLGDYRGSYDHDHLQDYAAKIKNWLSEGKDVYAYFNNTIGSAFENARTLQEIFK